MDTQANAPQDFNVIFAYTRANALADGVLIGLPPEAATACGFPSLARPGGIAMTAGVAECIGAPGYHNDGHAKALRARMLCDLFLAIHALPPDAAMSDRLTFKTRDHEGREVELWAQFGPGDDARAVLTIMLIGED